MPNSEFEQQQAREILSNYPGLEDIADRFEHFIQLSFLKSLHGYKVPISTEYIEKILLFKDFSHSHMEPFRLLLLELGNKFEPEHFDIILQFKNIYQIDALKMLKGSRPELALQITDGFLFETLTHFLDSHPLGTFSEEDFYQLFDTSLPAEEPHAEPHTNATSGLCNCVDDYHHA